ncbi:chromosomal replication initiator protein DnaA [Desulfovibrio sp. OttesenSCG-928-I05]|nr:chromosomal replication initiator protein DnaA [Desulfovibrio sp. OttesenSCG-928-I05]
METLWSKIQLHLQNALDPGNYKVWISPLTGTLKGSVFTVFAMNAFVADFIRNRFNDALCNAVHDVCGAGIEVRVDVARQERQSAPSIPANGEMRLSAPALVHTASGSQKAEPAAIQQSLPFRLPAELPGQPAARSWRHSFDDFIVGPSNALAFAAAQSICKDSRMADVLFLSSAPGLGKTHLTQAVGRHLCMISNRLSPRVEYLTAEEFCSRLFLSIKAGETDRFKARYRDVDLFLLEDVHFFQGKEKMQEELLATVKTLQEKGSKVIFSSSFSPRDLHGMSDQLLSRFSSGFLAYIDRPNRETRKRILNEKARFYQVRLPEDITDFLADSLDNDVRQLESCLQNLILKARLLGSAITMQMAWEIAGNYSSSGKKLDIEGIIRYVCEGFGITSDQIRSKSRKRELVTARNTVFYLARKHTELSLEEIGSRFCRSHSTVIKGITSLEREISRESSLGRQMANTIAIIERNGSIISSSSAGGRG